MNYSPLALLLILLSVAGCSGQKNGAEFLTANLGHYQFQIPKENTLDQQAGTWFSRFVGSVGGDDGSRSINFVISSEDIAKAVPAYKASEGELIENIVGTIAVLTAEEIQRYNNPGSGQVGDMWRATGSYKNRRVDHLDSVGLFKVYREVEYPKSWALLTQYPDPEKPLPDDKFNFWIAHCLKASSPLTSTGERINCSSYVYFDDIVIDFNIGEQNIEAIDSVREFLKITISSWNQGKKIQN